MKFYFAGTIRSGRERLNTFIKINELLEKYGTVLDKHVINPNVLSSEENFTLNEIYTRDINWLKECDMVVAEVSSPSLGIGYELAYAENLGKPIICVYDASINVSAMIRGNEYFTLIDYTNEDDLISKLEDVLKQK